MSANRYGNHICVLPEDDYNARIADEFLQNLPEKSLRVIQVMPVTGGWLKAVECFEQEYIPRLRNFSRSHVLLAIDFDHDVASRLRYVSTRIPSDVRDRVFVLGSLDEAEDLRRSLGDIKLIGSKMTEACRTDEPGIWSSPLLQHNAPELERLRHTVRPFLFQ